MATPTINYSALPTTLQSKFRALDPTPNGKLSVADQKQKMNATDQAKLKKLLAGLTPAQLNSVQSVTSKGSGASVPVAKINGLDGLKSGISSSNSAADVMTRSRNYAPGITLYKEGSSIWTGYIDVSASPTSDGFRLKVDSFHQKKSEPLNLFLQAEAYDPKSKELKTITFSVLSNKRIFNPNGQTGSGSWDIRLQDLNSFLKQKGTNMTVGPGSRLFVSAQWDKSHHRAGGPGRGAFQIPTPTGGNALSIQAKGALADFANVKPEDIPLDMQVPYSKALMRNWAVSSTLKRGGHIVSRLESEYKGATKTKKEMTDAIGRAYDLWEKTAKAGNNRAVEAIFGKGHTLTPIKRHWLADSTTQPKGTVKGKGHYKGFWVDSKSGFPALDPMVDVYDDTKNLDFTKSGAVGRLRSNGQKSGVLNFKDGGIVDPKTGIRQRVEIGYELAANKTMADANKLIKNLSDPSPSNSFRETVFNWASIYMSEAVPGANFSAKRTDLFDVVQQRHKFELKNTKTNVSQELSFDIVTVTTKRKEHADKNGKPRTVSFYVFEDELDHLQTSSANTVDYVADTATGGAFLQSKDQNEWLKKASKKSTLNVEPRLHSYGLLKSGLFRQTASYRSFEKSNSLSRSYFFPKGLRIATQKANFAANLLGLTPLAS